MSRVIPNEGAPSGSLADTLSAQPLASDDAPPKRVPRSSTAQNGTVRDDGVPRGTVGTTRTKNVEPIRQGLAELFTLIGVSVSTFDFQSGTHIIHESGRTSDAWANLAQKDPKVFAALSGLLKGSAYGAAIAATAAMLVPILIKYNVIPRAYGMFFPMVDVTVPFSDIPDEAPEE